MNKINCFDEVRFLLAFIVLIAHTSVLANAEQLDWVTQYFDSGFAVKGFFAISGYLVTKSYFSSANWLEYLEKRIRRIYPAYVAVIIYCLIVGAITTTMQTGEFVMSIESAKYAVSNLMFLNFLQPTLPGALLDNKMQALNGSLWTIKVEVMLYFIVPVLCFMYARIGKTQGFIVALIAGVTWFVYFSDYFNHPMGAVLAIQFPGQLPYFALGSVLSFVKFRQFHVFAIIVFSLIYYVGVKSQLDSRSAEVVNMIVYPLFVVAIANTSLLAVGVGKFGDLSYGIYLYHFPTIQLLEHLGFYDRNPYIGLLCSIVLTGMMAFLSWHVIEKRYLKRTSHYVKAAKLESDSLSIACKSK
ncbi:acyltransferase [Amphritea sp.]|uniref:acyltransferase family protein n=1 Tax=Amphritea sp. TaxID=1872502 RepID=UPI0025C48C2A|nr:acyltransferase [Amphritea sp.]